MTFKETYRLEKRYYQNIYTLLQMLKSLKENATASELEKVDELLTNAIADNESIILIYKNLGELYSEVALRFSELKKELDGIKEDLENWKDEINEKIDDVNNTLMVYIRELEGRISVLEEKVKELEYKTGNGIGNLENFEVIFDTSDLVGNVTNDSNIQYPYWYGVQRLDEDYIGCYFISSLYEVSNFRTLWTSLFPTFDPNFDIEIRVMNFLTNFDNIITPTGTNRTSFYHNSVATRAKCENGVVQEKKVVPDDTYIRRILTNIGSVENVIFGDTDEELYGHVIVVFYIYSSSKTVAEWTSWLNSQSQSFYNSIFEGINFLDGIKKEEDNTDRHIRPIMPSRSPRIDLDRIEML